MGRPGGRPNTQSREEWWGDQEGSQTLRAGSSGGETRGAAKRSETGGVAVETRRKAKHSGGWPNTQEPAKHSGAWQSDGGRPTGRPNTQEPSGVVGGDQQGSQTLRSRAE